MIHIFVVATGSYNKVINTKRIQSFNRLFPSEEKTFNFLSDSDKLIEQMKNILNDSYKSINYYHICNMVYPFVTLFKYNYIQDAAKMFNYNLLDSFLYFDATSFIMEKDDHFWENMSKDMQSFDICYSTNPCMNMPYIDDEIDTRSKHHVTLEEMHAEPDKWCQASFLSGNLLGLKKLNNIFNQLLLDDIRYSNHERIKQCILPNFMEQHYFNYIFYHADKYHLKVHHSKYIGEYGKECYENMHYCHYNIGTIINDKKYSTLYKEYL